MSRLKQISIMRDCFPYENLAWFLMRMGERVDKMLVLAILSAVIQHPLVSTSRFKISWSVPSQLCIVQPSDRATELLCKYKLSSFTLKSSSNICKLVVWYYEITSNLYTFLWYNQNYQDIRLQLLCTELLARQKFLHFTSVINLFREALKKTRGVGRPCAAFNSTISGGRCNTWHAMWHNACPVKKWPKGNWHHSILV